MARINLLPWRQEERLRKNKEFNVVLGAAALLAALLVGATFLFFNSQLDAQNQANAAIEAENARLDGVNKEIETLEQRREEMIAQMKLIQDLQGKRSVPVRVWEDIARAIPSAMYLVRMTRTDDLITIEGFADNANVVSDLVRRLDASPWLADSRIPTIQSKVEAYQAVPARPQSKDGTPRQPYPEDNYISFTITTTVVTEDKKTEEGTDPNAPANAGVPTDPNAPPADPNATQAPASDATTHQAVVEQPGDAMQPVPVQPATAPAPSAEPAGQPAPQPAPAPQPETVVQPAPATDAGQPAPQPQPAGGQ